MAATSRRIAASALLLFIALTAAALGIRDAYVNRPPTREEAFPTGEIVVAVDTSFPPFAVDIGGELAGLDIDLARAIGEEIGLPVRFAPISYDGLYDALINGQVDIVVSALLVNPSRTREVRYTQHYFDNGLLLVMAPDSAITHPRDLPSHSVALEYGSVAHSEARKWQEELDPFAIRPYELPRYALDALRLGEADSALVDTTSYLLYQGEHPEWQSEAYRISSAFYAVAVRHDREATFAWVDAALGRIRHDGRLQEMIERWFSPEP